MASHNKKSSGDAFAAIKAVLLIGAVIMIVVIIVGMLYFAGINKVTDTDDEKDSEQPDNNLYAENILPSSDEPAPKDTDVILDIPGEEAFLLLDTAKRFYSECRFTTIADGDIRYESTAHMLCDGNLFSFRVYEGKTLVQTVKCDGENILFKNETTGKQRIISAENHNFYSISGVPYYEDLKLLVSDFLINGENSELIDFNCSTDRTGEENLVRASLTYKDSGIVEKYDYNADLGYVSSLTGYISDDNSLTEYFKFETTFFTVNIENYTQDNSFLVE